MIETCSKSESTNAVINNKLERHKGLPVQQIRVSLIFFGFGGTTADLSLVTTAFLILLL